MFMEPTSVSTMGSERTETREDTEVVSLQHLKSAKTRAQVRGSLGHWATVGCGQVWDERVLAEVDSLC